ncbi:MAG: AAA family ATPase [Promethearchaeota archaeon]
MPSKKIGIVGMPGSGKSTAADFLKDERNAVIICMGNIVREQVQNEGLPVNAENLGRMAEELRKKHGPGIIAELTAKKVESIPDKNALIIIDGIRSMDEVNSFRKRWPLHILAIYSPPRVRHERLKKRKRDDDIIDDSYFQLRDSRELGFGIGDVIALADAAVINDENTSEKQFKHELLKVIDGLVS